MSSSQARNSRRLNDSAYRSAERVLGEQQPDFVQHAVHFLVREVADGLAGEFWDQMVGNRKTMGEAGRKRANRFYRENPRRAEFVTQKWPQFIITARQTLVLLLGKPGFDERAKADIYDALLLDSTFNPRKLSREAQAAWEIEQAKRNKP